ncbi:MAG: TldD/PmbA family protein [Deltaproteobacteria bacterium]|nr:TldD/PmbA family protein [Deltaproteobacteria bacterium]
MRGHGCGFPQDPAGATPFGRWNSLLPSGTRSTPLERLIRDVPLPSDRSPSGYFERFGVDGAILASVLDAALSRGADDADLFFEHAVATRLSVSDGAVNRASTSVDLGLGVRVVVGDQVGYAFTEVLEPETMREAARIASGIAVSSSPRIRAPFAVRAPLDLYPANRRWDAEGMEARVPLVRGWEEEAFARDPRVVKVQISLLDTERVLLVVRPDGRVVQDHQPMTVASISCTAEEGGRRETSSSNVASRSGREFWDDPTPGREMVEKAVDQTTFLLSAGSPPAGEMPVVLGAGPSGILLHEAIGHGMEADFVRKGTSLYGSRVGTRIASEHVTIVDDGTLPHSRGSIGVDDEGNLPQRTVLVENGVLKGFLHDEISARHFGVAPTGSGRREGFRHPPLPRMRVTFMEGGPDDPREIVAGVRRGIYCATFGNGQVQIGAGDFAFYMRTGWLIEDGRLTRPLKDANLVGNGPMALERITRVGNDLLLDSGGWTCGKQGQGVPVSHGIPTVLVSSLVVGGA